MKFLCHSFLLGIYVTFIYDLIRILRRIIRHNKFWVSVEDLAFWIFCGVKFFLLVYHENSGKLRWYSVAAVLVGMTLYCKLISPCLIRVVPRTVKKQLTRVCKMTKMCFRR